MAIVAMKHLRLVGLESEREALLKALQDMGCVEVSGVDGAEDALDLVGRVLAHAAAAWATLNAEPDAAVRRLGGALLRRKG